MHFSQPSSPLITHGRHGLRPPRPSYKFVGYVEVRYKALYFSSQLHLRANTPWRPCPSSSPTFTLTVGLAGPSMTCWLVDPDHLTPFPTEDRRYRDTGLDLPAPSAVVLWITPASTSIVSTCSWIYRLSCYSCCLPVLQRGTPPLSFFLRLLIFFLT